MTDAPDARWEQGWDGHERAQRMRLARLPLAEKIRWLEEAQRTVLALERARAAVSSRDSRAAGASADNAGGFAPDVADALPGPDTRPGRGAGRP